MPTRIVFSNAASPSPRSPEPDTQQFPDRATFFAVEPFGNRSLDHNHSVREQAGTKPQSNSRLSYSTPPGSRRVVTFGHSILREFALRSSDEGVNETRALTSDDIRASPRFVGYLFSMIAAAVQLVSVVQFYRQDTLVQEERPAVDNDVYFVTTGGGLVYRWKLWGAVYAGSIGVGLSLLILLAHFDTVFFSQLWMHVFRDGSIIERNLILLLIVFWAAALHVCTSSLSIGEQQGNVYFTTWIAFGSIVLNYGVWRESAGLPSLAEQVNTFQRETTYNWMWIGFFSAIFAGAATDMFRNRDEIELRFQGEILELKQDNWKLVLAIVWTEVTVCALAIALNESVIDTWYLPFTIHQFSGATLRYACGWRQLEGLIMLAGVGAKFWVIVEFSGVAGVINGLSNSYFGLWGTFFNSVFGLGTWLRENKHFEYISRDSEINRSPHRARTRP